MTPATLLEESAAGVPTAAPAGGGREGERVAGGLGSAGEGEAAGEMPSTEQTQWLIMKWNAAQARCKELESILASTREELTKRDTSEKVAREKIRHLEAESRALLTAAEFREKEASSMQEGVSLAQERAHAHEKALASALEQLSDSGVSQSKKLEELAQVSDELKRTKAALERAERLVFDQRREADERQADESRRRAETEALRAKLARVEQKNTELMAKHAAGRLGKRIRGNFGRRSTFCASFCSCFRGRPAYRRVASPAPFAPHGSTSSADSPWFGEEAVAAGSLRGF
eukprot:g5434.t1